MNNQLCHELFPDMKTIIPEATLGDYSIQYFTISEGEASFLKMKGMFNRSYLARFLQPGDFCRLIYKDQILMSNTHAERHSNLEIVNRAHGQVLIAGLGLGLIICPIAKKDDVTHITVVEIAKEVIDLVEPHLRDYLGEDAHKLEIINADIFEFEPSHKYDVIYFDIWGCYSGDEYPQTKKLHIKFSYHINRKNDPFMDSWMRWDMKDRYFECR